MDLFVINNANVQSALQEASGIEYSDRDYSRLWVNGKKDSDGTWFSNTSRMRPILPGLDWLNGDSKTGECLSILRYNKQNKQQFQGWDCSGIAWTYCELKRCPH